MRIGQLLRIVGDEPLFDTGLLLAGGVDRADVERQLSRWVRSGKILKLRRGLYALAQPLEKRRPHPFLIANRLVRPSYVSLESALAFHGLIPEYVPVVTSVTTNRPGRHATPLGPYGYRRIKDQLLWGYAEFRLPGDQQALVARPEKALLDLLYLRAAADRRGFIEELRLQNLDRLDLERLQQEAQRVGSAKASRALGIIIELARAEVEEYEAL